MKTLRILLADDHDVVRFGLKVLLGPRQGWVVCGEATTGREAVEMALSLQPDVAILDQIMPELNGIEAARKIRAAVPQAQVLMFTVHESDDLVREALKAGARGYLLKSDASQYIIAAVEALAQNRPFFSKSISERLLDNFLKPDRGRPQAAEPFAVLTPREREVVQLLAEGQSNKGVANSLGLSVKTVETHRATIMRKLSLGSLADLVRYAVRNKMLQP